MRAYEKSEVEQASTRLWVVSELYYPEDTSTGYYLTRIAEGLAGDFEVKVLCGQPNYFARGVTAPKHEVHKGVEIFRVSGTRLDKNVIFFRLINMLSLSISIFANAILKFKRGDRVLVVTNPPSMPFVVAFAALVKGAAYTLLIHDNYPEILVACGKARPDSFLVNVVTFFNRWLYKSASKIIVVGRDMQELIQRKTDGLNVPIAIIPNWAELESVSPAERSGNKLLQELGIVDRTVFLYAGNMGYPNDLESIVECAVSIRERADVHFVFLGTGVKRKWLENYVAENQLTNVTVLDPRPRNEQSAFLNACDVGLVSLVTKMVGVSMPSRTYNILAAGKPILALTESGSEVARVVSEEQVGWIVPPGNPTMLKEVVLEIVDSREQLRQMGASARKAAIAKYSLESALKRYREELEPW
ncbi:MAG TPA: glycosyltransferase family 4 protein [Pyrinomonadaceae bacterium]